MTSDQSGAIRTTSGGKGKRALLLNESTNINGLATEYLPPAVELIERCFHDDPVIRFMMCSLSDEARAEYYPDYMHSLLKAASLNNAIFEEANEWSCCAVWMPPGKRVDNPFTLIQAGILTCLWRLGFAGCKRMLYDYQGQSDACKKRGLRDSNGKAITRYHYLFFVATDPSARGQGLASKLMAKQQEQARQDGLPIWLEATTKHSRDIYERLGFKEVQEMRLGKGTHAASGAFERGGPGVRLWAMFWSPQDPVQLE